MKKLFFVLCVFLSISLFGQSPPLHWLSVAGSNTVDQAHSVCYDGSGNVYSTGLFKGTVDFDASSSVFTLTSNGGSDFFVMKNDPNGNFLWAKSLGGSNNDEAYGIDITSTGDLIIIGDFESQMDFDPSSATYTLQTNGNKDVFILKISASGNFIWAKSFGSSGEENGVVLTNDQSGNIYVGGYFSDTTDFDPGVGTFTMTANQLLRDSYALKLDANGNFLWAKTFGGSVADDGVSGLAVDGSGNLYISATFMYTVDVDPGISTFTLASPNVWSTAVIKLDASGNFLWGKKIGGSSDTFCGQSAVDAAGNVYTVGNFQGTTDFDPGTSTFLLTPAGLRDIWVSKLDAAGNFVWAKIMGGTQFMDIGIAITLDATGDVYLTGSFDGVADMDPGTNSYTLNSLGGSGDIFAMKLSSAGNFIWAEGFGSTGADMGRAIRVDANGSVYLSGFYSGTTDFYPGVITYTVNSAGNNDLFVQKLGACVSTPPAPLNSTPVNNQTLCAAKPATLIANGLGNISWYNVSTGGTVIATGNVFITPTLTSGTHTFFCEAGSTCGNSTSRTPVSVLVHPQPLVTANSGTVCYGSGFELGLTGAVSYIIGNIIYPMVTNVHTITGTNSFGCVSAPVTVTVIVSPAPTVTALSGTMCIGSNFSIMPTGASSYTISGGNFVVSPTVTTTYSIIGTHTTGCKSMNPAFVTITVHTLPTITVGSGSLCAGQSFTMAPTGALSYTYLPSGPVVNPSITTAYSVTGISIQGCGSAQSAVAVVSVSPLPVVSISDHSLCTGNSHLLSPVGATNYTYLPTGPAVSPTSTSNYTVTGSDPSGCTSLPVVSTIWVWPLPSIKIVSTDTIVCAGKSVTLTATGAKTYSWNTGAATSTLLALNNTHSYIVTGIDTNGCSNKQSLTIIVSLCTSDAEDKKTTFTVFPNPATDFIELGSSGSSTFDFVLLNSTGEIVQQQENSNTRKIQLDALPKGLYYLRIESGNEKLVYKVVKN